MVNVTSLIVKAGSGLRFSFGVRAWTEMEIQCVKGMYRLKLVSCAAIFRLGIVVLQCVRAGEVFCGLHVAHVRIICPVCDITHVRKCTRPSPALPYCKRREAGRGPGNEATL